MIILGIETTCDETACAIVKDGKEILSNIVYSQIKLHEPYGGVVPELACRKHVDVLIPIIDQALQEAKLNLSDIDAFAVAYGPGLIGALLVGVNAAKALAFSLEKPIIPVNHVEAHLYAALMSTEKQLYYPALGIVLSGGHTSIVLLKEIGHYELIGHTIDDAIGEAFDKTAKLMGLPYPGGPEIEKLAKKGNPFRFPLKSGVVKNNPFDFSLSGLKTAVFYTVQKLGILSEEDKADIAASFQQAVFTDLQKKIPKAAKKYNCKQVIFGGGVTNNKALRTLFSGEEYIWPRGELTIDNAAMIAGLAYHKSAMPISAVHASCQSQF